MGQAWSVAMGVPWTPLPFLPVLYTDTIHLF